MKTPAAVLSLFPIFVLYKSCIRKLIFVEQHRKLYTAFFHLKKSKNPTLVPGFYPTNIGA